MTKPEEKSEQEQNAALQEIIDEESGEIRTLHGFERHLVPIIAVIWSLFQLSISSWLLLDSIAIRAIHLAFALVLLFLNIPFFKKPKPFLKFLSARDHISWNDYLCAALGAISALYLYFDWEGIANRSGMPTTTDVVFGIILLVLLLDAARRALGPALSIIALVFSAYAYFGPYMPDILAFRGVSVTRYLSQITLSGEGIYGIPLDVSARVVFLYVLLGGILEKAGAGKFFIDLALCFLGRFKGGPAKAAVLASGFTGMVSGSSIANIVTTGTFTIPLMKKVGYPATKAAAIEVAASTDGQLAPPIMGAAAFIIAEYVNVPYVAVVKAAAIPAFASYVALLYITHIEASKLGLRGLRKDELPILMQTLMEGLHFLIPIGALLYELIYLRHSPDKSAFNAILWLVFVVVAKDILDARGSGGFIGKGIKKSLSTIYDGLASGAKNMVTVAVACASAGIIVGVVNMGIGGMITQIVEQLSGGNIYLMLMITAIASLLIGMGLPTTATYIVMASLTAPIIVEVGGLNNFVVPLMAAHLFCFYFGILADDTPPVGLASYAAAALARSDPIKTGIQGFMYDIRTSILPFMFIFNSDLILHNINSWPLGILIFIMACVGTCAFASATQGWFLMKNKWYDLFILLGISLIMFRPGLLSEQLSLPNKYLAYPIGLLILGAFYLLQKRRLSRSPATA
ncbi:MAG: TRAP transporter permease [Deltaproteobacteria bacterium]|nr:TRAP transporter permease [Candidatus Tharpella aukensis]